MRPSRCSMAIVSIEPSSSRSTKPASPLTDGGTRRDGGKAGVLAGDAGEETHDLVGAADRVERRGALAAAVRIQHGVLGQNACVVPAVSPDVIAA